jgi:MurNAc alpha-1-phosphate uridylyltransferase
MKKAMIFAAGLGTRLKPFTDHHPKALAQVNGKTLLERNVRFLYQAGIREIVINTHHFADQVEASVALIAMPELTIHLSHEKDGPLETGGGLAYARGFLKDDTAPFVVMNVDILTDIFLPKMMHYHLTHRPLATLAVTDRDSSRKLLFDKHMQLAGWQHINAGLFRWAKNEVENTQAFAFSGIHIIDPAIFNMMPLSGKFSITDLYLTLASEHKILGYNHSGDIVLDVGKPESLEKAALLFA